MTYSVTWEQLRSGSFMPIVTVTHGGQWRFTEQPDPGDEIPDVPNDPVPEPDPEPEGEPE